MAKFIDRINYLTFDASGDFTSDPLDLSQLVFYTFQLIADGDVVGKVQVQESVDNSIWNVVKDSGADATPIEADVNAGSPSTIQIGNSPAKYCRLSFISTSGTGNATVSFFGKGY
jgi:hypothetical protein